MRLVTPAASSLAGEVGVAQLHQLQSDMRKAMSEADYTRVRQLDTTCAVVLDKLIELNRDQPGALLRAMGDIKQLYADLLGDCESRAQYQHA
jgi:ABC-type transporter Mla MlaB component